jgi:hypothetical protein
MKYILLLILGLSIFQLVCMEDEERAQKQPFLLHISQRDREEAFNGIEQSAYQQLTDFRVRVEKSRKVIDVFKYHYLNTKIGDCRSYLSNRAALNHGALCSKLQSIKILLDMMGSSNHGSFSKE